MPAFCFMVMPFGRKMTGAAGGAGPAEIDFNALWDKAFFPMLAALGYQPIRADQETGALIVNQMLERLYFSDLVLADLTIPNGNVYYEIGVRHAAKASGCVLLAADWSKQLFDVAQMRTLRYPLPKADVDDADAQAIRTPIEPHVEKMRAGRSPLYEVLPGYPGPVDGARAAGVLDQVSALAAFQAEMRALRALPAEMRQARTPAILQRYCSGPVPASVAVGLLRLLVDEADSPAKWQAVLDYIGGLDPEVAPEPYVREQRALALGKLELHQDAIAELEALIQVAGDSSERQGLLGGRYKDLMRAAVKAGRARDVAVLRDRAIEHYERGMMLDLNDYYPLSNLPRLYMARGRKGDAARAQVVLNVVGAACQRALDRGSTDEWVRPTMLGAAFDRADADAAEELADQVEREGAGTWKLATTLKSLEESTVLVADVELRTRLTAILDRLRPLLSPAA